MSKECARNSKKGFGGLAVGQAVLIYTILGVSQDSLRCSSLWRTTGYPGRTSKWGNVRIGDDSTANHSLRPRCRGLSYLG